MNLSDLIKRYLGADHVVELMMDKKHCMKGSGQCLDQRAAPGDKFRDFTCKTSKPVLILRDYQRSPKPGGIEHAMRTQGEPLIALYLWRGGNLSQKSEIC